MFAWLTPQNSAQKPFHACVPRSRFGVNHMKFDLFVIRSRLPPICGIQKEWRTSTVLSSKLAVRPTGR